MCEFVSFIELKDNIYFLTNDCLRTKEGKALKEYLGSAYADDIKGHGAIRRYFGLPDNKGTNLEIYDFANPNKFPAAIVEAIKSGAMSKIAPPPKGILTAPLYADYKAKQDALYADYKAKQAPLDADYEAKKAPLYADYQAKRAPLDADYKAKQDALYDDYKAKQDALYADYQAKRDALYADYQAKRAPLDADYKAKRAPLDADYEAKKAPLYADYQAKQDALDTATWKLITNPRNRVKEWE